MSISGENNRSNAFTEMDEYILLPKNGQNFNNILVLLHGANAVGNEMHWVANELGSQLPNTAFFAPKSNVVQDASNDRRAWFLEKTDTRDNFENACDVLNDYIKTLAKRYDIPLERVALLGYSQGMTVAVGSLLATDTPCGAIAGFSGVIRLSPSASGKEKYKNIPVILVHGADDKAVPPERLKQNSDSLHALGFDVKTSLREGVEHYVDRVGLRQAAEFLRDNWISKLDKLEKQRLFDPKGVKLVIWDLDDTLWSGTLAEGDDVELNEYRVGMLRKFNQHGIVSSVVSKNDYETAKKRLIELDVWDHVVFPKISFSPKGPIVASLIEEMQLRAPNVVFIDDNVHNLAEVEAFCPGISTINAFDDSCDDALSAILEAHKHVSKSRVDQYRSLQKKSEDMGAAGGSTEDFLRSCGINVAVAWRADANDFAVRIEELINRTNQLNFMKTRVAPGEMATFLSEPMLRESFVIFVWDKYGYHGLVGFVGVDIPKRQILHMAFSCRIMNMGIEEWVLQKVMDRFADLKVPEGFPIKPKKGDWITEAHFSHEHTRKFIFEKEKSKLAGASANIRIMANCQSGALAHFCGLRDEVEIDNFPRAFHLAKMLDGSYLKETFPRHLVYGIYIDYFDSLWPKEYVSRLNDGLYAVLVDQFCAFVEEKKSKIAVIFTPSGIPPEKHHPHLGITPERIDIFKTVWLDMSRRYDHITIFDIDSICSGSEMLDDTHFPVDATRKIAEEIRQWYLSDRIIG